MRIIVIGADGYLGWPTCVHLANRGHEVIAVDSLIKRQWDAQGNTHPLVNVLPVNERVQSWNRLHPDKLMKSHIGCATDPDLVDCLLDSYEPHAIVHYGEQRSAPFSMTSRRHAILTNQNNTNGTLNLLWSIREKMPSCHFVKLGTMGEYGTPNVPIPEGHFELEYRGRRDVLPFPKSPGSFYHASKVADSTYQELAAKVWGLRITDLNQGVVWGTNIDEFDDLSLPDFMRTTFQYDGVFGTALNRFIVQGVADMPITVYGKGGQTRGFLNLNDTVQCVRIAIENEPEAGKMRVLNQFTEQFSVNALADMVAAETMGRVHHLANPRFELEEHFYQADHSKLLELGMVPRKLTPEAIRVEADYVRLHQMSIDRAIVAPRVLWK